MGFGVRLAEEIGDVGGDGVDQMFDLGMGEGAVEHGAVVGEVAHPQRPQPFDQPAAHHLALVIAEDDAGFTGQERRQEPEFPITQVEFALVGVAVA